MNRHKSGLPYSGINRSNSQIEDYPDRISSSLSFDSHKKSLNKNSSLIEQNFKKWKVYKDTDFNKNFYDDNENIENENLEEPNYDEVKRFSYCYLCSVQGHVHTKTEPVPMNKRRYLRPYVNPIQLMRKYEQIQKDPELTTNYKIMIKTGPGQYGGTNSEVFIKLFGTTGIWNQTELKVAQGNKSMKFPPESLIDIELIGPIIGDLKKLKIWHSGKSIKDGWYLDYVEIFCTKLKQTWKFICNRWISKYRPPDYRNSILLNSINENLANEKLLSSVEYFFLIKTGDKQLPASDINVQFQFVGTKAQSIIFNLISPYTNLFEPNQLDAFLITSSTDLGKPEKLRMALEHNDRKLPSEWAIEELKVIYSKEPNKFYTFRLDRWVEKNHKINGAITPVAMTTIDPSGEDEPGKCIYHVTILTGNAKLAGTDAKIFIEISGEKGNTSIHRLTNHKKNEFERNKQDHFHIFDVNVGQIRAIRIFHDNSGTFPGWFLDAILIKSVTTKITGNKEKHDAELIEQLEKLRKKFKTRDLKLSNPIQSRKRSTSAELRKAATKPNRPPSPTRSASAEPSSTKDLSKGVLKKNLEKSTNNSSSSSTALDGLSRASPTSSILKTSASPRSGRKDARKQVKFNSNEIHHPLAGNSAVGVAKPDEANNKQQTQANSSKLEMKINWLMTVYYNEQKTTKNIKSIENFDKNLKNTDEKLLDKYFELAMKKVSTNIEEELRNEMSKKNRSNSPDNFIYVFECRNWLAKDIGDRKIERILKVKNILRN